MNLLLFAGSLRQESYNRKLLAVAQGLLAEMPGVTVNVADLKALAFPVYDGDIETAGMPESVKSLGQMIQSADALVIASPEYNASISSPLKNAVDWVSRLRPIPLDKKPVLLMGTSPGAFGSIRGFIYLALVSLAKVPMRPSWKSIKACLISPIEFITNGP